MKQMRNQILLVTVIALLVVGGGIGLYFLTIPGSSASSLSRTQALGGAGGYQIGYAPEGVWASYLGYVPQSYNLAPHAANAPTWPCPAGMSSSACAQFKQSCGNGVCDPNESCSTCPLDCAPSGDATCDPYTGRIGAPVNVCFLGGHA